MSNITLNSIKSAINSETINWLDKTAIDDPNHNRYQQRAVIDNVVVVIYYAYTDDYQAHVDGTNINDYYDYETMEHCDWANPVGYEIIC